MAGDEHIIEAIGRCRIIIRDGKVVEVGPPAISSCPLAERFAKPVREITSEAVRENIQARIQEFGMCTADRAVYAEGEFVGFGASELIGNGLIHGVLDCAVLASDGAGTVLATTPGLVQGIGGRMSGLVKTIPIPEVVDRIERNGGMVLDRTGGRDRPARGNEARVCPGIQKDCGDDCHRRGGRRDQEGISGSPDHRGAHDRHDS